MGGGGSSCITKKIMRKPYSTIPKQIIVALLHEGLGNKNKHFLTQLIAICSAVKARSTHDTVVQKVRNKRSRFCSEIMQFYYGYLKRGQATKRKKKF